MCVVVLGLAFYKVVSIPGLDGLPVIGHHFKEDKITYEELHQKYVNMVQLNEQKLQMEAQKELELKAAEIQSQSRKASQKTCRTTRPSETAPCRSQTSWRLRRQRLQCSYDGV